MQRFQGNVIGNNKPISCFTFVHFGGPRSRICIRRFIFFVYIMVLLVEIVKASDLIECSYRVDFCNPST